jgi:accessory colonization factor AcfC
VERDLEAWISYWSWHLTMRDEAEFLPILGHPDALRFTPLALTRRTAQRRLAEQFVRFLRSDEAHGVFRQYGWE